MVRARGSGAEFARKKRRFENLGIEISERDRKKTKGQ